MTMDELFVWGLFFSSVNWDNKNPPGGIEDSRKALRKLLNKC